MSETAVARDYMTGNVITVTPDTDIHAAIRVLVENKISGAPVLNADGDLVGMLSTRDCLKVAFSASYYQDSGGRVADYMSDTVQTVDVATDMVEVAELFVKSRYRRFPVTKNDRLVGLISRYDALAAVEKMW